MRNAKDKDGRKIFRKKSIFISGIEALNSNLDANNDDDGVTRY